MIRNSNSVLYDEPAWRLLMLWLAGIVGVTLFPFDFHVPHAAWERLNGPFRPQLTEIVLNTLLFVPLGALMYSRVRHRRSGFEPMIVATAAGFLISLIVESVQIYLPRRDPSLLDLASNTAGAVVGAFAQRGWGNHVNVYMARMRARASLRLLAYLLTAYALTSLGVSATLQRRTQLRGWDATYPLVVGNESSGDRPWRGRIVRFEMTDAAASPAISRKFAATGAVPLAGNRVADFDFSGPAPFRDATGTLPSLVWTEPTDASGAEPGITIGGRAWLQTRGPATALVRRLQERKAFTVRLVCATADINQHGPARIVSNSRDVGLRNFTLGQQGSQLVVRIRSPHSGLNGARPQIVVPDVFATTAVRDILVTFDGATILAAVAGSDRVHLTEFTPASSLALAMTSLDVDADQLGMLNKMYIALLFAVPGFLVGMLAQTARRRVAVGLVWVPLFTMCSEGALIVASGRWVDWAGVLVTATVGGAAFAAVANSVAATASREPKSSSLTCTGQLLTASTCATTHRSS